MAEKVDVNVEKMMNSDTRLSSSGQPAHRRKVQLPSGTVWKGGAATGASAITLPDDDSVPVAGTAAANDITNTTVGINSLARAIHAILDITPKFFVRIISRATITNPAEHQVNRTPPVRRASGGMVSGPGGPRDDSILTRLSNGEYVVNAAATAKTLPLLEAINAGWVPSPRFLAGMLPGFAMGGLIGDAASKEWRNLLAGSLEAPTSPATTGFRPEDFGIYGWVGDALSGLGNAAADAGGAAGAALGSAIAPLFASNGILGTLFGGSTDSSQPMAALKQRPGPGVDGAPDPLTASLRIEPRGIPWDPSRPGEFSTPVGKLSDLYRRDLPPNTQSEGLAHLGKLADSFGYGLEDAATKAGSRVGAALGTAIGPALGPAGALAPEIGAQLGSLVGSRFGGSLRASMTVSGEARTTPETLGGAPAPSTQPGSSPRAPGGSGGVQTGGAGGFQTGGGGPASGQPKRYVPSGGSETNDEWWEYLPAGADGASDPVWAYYPGGGSTGITYPADPAGPLVVPEATDPGLFSSILDGLRKQPKLPLDSPGETLDSPGTDPHVPIYSGGSATYRLRQPRPEQESRNTHGPQPTPNAGGHGLRLPAFDSGQSSEDAAWRDIPEADTLEQQIELYNPFTGDFTGLTKLAGGQVGADLGGALDAALGGNGGAFGALGRQLGVDLGATVGTAYENADPENQWLGTIGAMIGNATNIEWTPLDVKPPPDPTWDQQVGMAALQSGIAGAQQHGLVGGITGAIRGAASGLGGFAGGAIGTLVAPALGPLGVFAPKIGEMLGSMVASTAADFVAKPIELAASAAKEEIGSGFGLVDLARGAGGRTARGDIYNFNGMDPKSAAIAVERVRRRRTVAQQRGGGLGR
ncbi:hypothetical protein [Nocardia sp. CNY236]|uniref:hypothetical protein n=1 Tax=Nocardia sp. CNY236 TaxID=1169152 RepID=UPI0018C97BEF|nr:hypothetical protein [Nocardia sp. CNY236]